MESAVSVHSDCLAHLDAGGQIVTADARQARALRRLHDAAQVAAGRRAWPTAQIRPLDAWLAEVWREAEADRPDLPQVLPAAASRWLWRHRVADGRAGLVDADDLGLRVRASWLQLRAYGGMSEALAHWPLTRDQQAFVDWSRDFERTLAGRGVCDGADLATALVAADALPPPGPPLLLVGFRVPTPAESAVFASLARRGWPVRHHVPDVGPGAGARFEAADPVAERDAAIDWLRARIAERPAGVHAWLVPDLDGCRGALERALEAGLQPALELEDRDASRLFDLAGGQALSARPEIAIGLEALRLAAGHGDWRLASRVLRSPQLAIGGELESRVRLDLRLRRDGRAYPELPAALARAARHAGAPAFASTLDAAAACLAGPARRSAGAWAESFGACLATWGWAQGATTRSAEWQAAGRFSEVLRELATIGVFAPDLPVADALAELEVLASAPFQPEGGEPALLVLDGTTDLGIGLDSLWVAGLTATAWPQPVRVDPFIPIEAQRRLGFPRATAQGCMHDARSRFQAWQRQSAARVLSWPRRVDDTDVDASPLIPAGLETARLDAAPPVRARRQWIAAAAETLVDDDAPPLPPGPVRGGARRLELQSRCPFRAFAELRLQAPPLEEPEPGLDRRLRGQVLHRAMDLLWSSLRTQAALLALAPPDCDARIEAAVEQALAECGAATHGTRTRALERDWQRRTVGNLLALDRARAPFEVRATEAEMTGQVGALQLRLRADRVDDVDGALVVIDYKTGAVKPAAWRGARLDAPQLPLYAVLHQPRPAAIAFALVGAGEARLLGVGEESVTIQGLIPAASFALTEEREKGFSWPAITEHWWAWLDALARQHAAGRADVDPKLGVETCRGCHLGALCRVDPAAARAEEAAEADDAD